MRRSKKLLIFSSLGFFFLGVGAAFLIYDRKNNEPADRGETETLAQPNDRQDRISKSFLLPEQAVTLEIFMPGKPPELKYLRIQSKELTWGGAEYSLALDVSGEKIANTIVIGIGEELNTDQLLFAKTFQLVDPKGGNVLSFDTPKKEDGVIKYSVKVPFE